MSFNSARNSLAPGPQAAVDSLLGEWAGATEVPLQAAANLRAEVGLELGTFTRYLEGLAARAGEMALSSPSAGSVFVEVGRPFALAGHEGQPHRDAVFGRAVLLENYARYLRWTLYGLGVADAPDEILRTLRSLDDMAETAVPTSSRIYLDAMKQTLLGKGATYATFVTPVVPDRRPWSRPAPDAGTIRDMMGLGEDPPGRDYILFAYKLPGGESPRVPTVASAGWFYQRWFRPNPAAATELHGWTRRLGAGTHGVPEVVHAEINGGTLVFPVLLSTL
jgi:hypothetical protein